MNLKHHIRFELLVLGLVLSGCTTDNSGPNCGDGLCSGETNAECPADCPIAGPTCGDGICIGETNATCTDDCPSAGPFCGDSSCNGTETISSCQNDCGMACISDPSMGADLCTGETICVSGWCLAAFPRVYTLYANVSAFGTNGGAEWDPGNGAPDLYLRIGTNAPSSVIQDQHSADFGPIDVPLVMPSSIAVGAWDEDGVVDAPVVGCSVPTDAASLRNRYFGCAPRSTGVLSGSLFPK